MNFDTSNPSYDSTTISSRVQSVIAKLDITSPNFYVKGNEKVVITEVILINPSIDSTTTPKPSISFAVGIHQNLIQTTLITFLFTTFYLIKHA